MKSKRGLELIQVHMGYISNHIFINVKKTVMKIKGILKVVTNINIQIYTLR